MQAYLSYNSRKPMGMYINKGNNDFRDIVASTILDEYVMLLRHLFKTQESDEVFAGAYLTGILPIKKYNTESALNNFREYSMITPGRMANALGYTSLPTK